MSEEEKLIAQIKQTPEAFRELYRRYYPRVFAYVAYRVGRREDAEDIVSEVFIRAVQGLKTFEYRGDGAFSAWLFRIAVNEINRFYSLHRNRVEYVPLDELPDIESSDLPPDVAVMRKEEFLRLRALIATLTPRRQEIVTLRFFGALRNQEIATVLGLDERTVASHLSRALEDLQRQFQTELKDESR